MNLLLVLLGEFLGYITRVSEVNCFFYRYYANGICREGEACRYLHQGQAGSSSATSVRTGTSETRCRFYQRGSCAYGSRCHFVHAGEVSTPSTNNVSQNTSIASSSTILKNSPTRINRNGQGTKYRYIITL
jgi:hypothetical protein